MRYGETEREQMIDSLAAWMKIRKDIICNFCNRGSRSLERYGCQRREARHLIFTIKHITHQC